MNLASIIILAVVAVAVILIGIHLITKGDKCSSCSIESCPFCKKS